MQRRRDLRPEARQVRGLGKVEVQVVEVRASRVEFPDELVVAPADGRLRGDVLHVPVRAVVPHEGLGAALDRALPAVREHALQAAAVLVLGQGHGRADPVRDGGEEVVADGRDVAARPAGDARSTDEQRDADPAFPDVGLAPGERYVTRHRHVRLAAVVRGEDDIRRVREAVLVERFEDATDARVEFRGHGRVHGVRVGQVDEASQGTTARRLRRDEPVELLDGLRVRQHRRVHGVVGSLHEERPASRGLLGDEAHRLVGHLAGAFRVRRALVARRVGRDAAVRVVAVAFGVLPAHVPFPEMAGRVVRIVRLQELGDRDFLVRQFADRQRYLHGLVDVHRVVEELDAGATLLVGHHVDDVGRSEAGGGLSRLDAHAGGRAVRRRGVGVRERHALSRQAFEAWRPVQVADGVRKPGVHLHGGAGPALVVREDQDDVLCGRRHCGASQQRAGQTNGGQFHRQNLNQVEALHSNGLLPHLQATREKAGIPEAAR